MDVKSKEPGKMCNFSCSQIYGLHESAGDISYCLKHFHSFIFHSFISFIHLFAQTSLKKNIKSIKYVTMQWQEKPKPKMKRHLYKNIRNNSMFKIGWSFFFTFLCLSWIAGDSLICRTCRVGIMGKCLFSGSKVCSQSEPNCHSSELGECLLVFALIFEWLLKKKRKKKNYPGKWMFVCVRVVIYRTNWHEVVGKKCSRHFNTDEDDKPAWAQPRVHPGHFHQEPVPDYKYICNHHNDVQWNLLRSPELIW